MEKITVVVPCYNEEAALGAFYREITAIAETMAEVTFEFLFINDGSKDQTLKIIKGFAKQDERVKYISFSRNFGKEAGIYAGLENASGDYVVVMDADLQDPPGAASGDVSLHKRRRLRLRGHPPCKQEGGAADSVSLCQNLL